MLSIEKTSISKLLLERVSQCTHSAYCAQILKNCKDYGYEYKCFNGACWKGRGGGGSALLLNLTQGSIILIIVVALIIGFIYFFLRKMK